MRAHGGFEVVRLGRLGGFSWRDLAGTSALRRSIRCRRCGKGLGRHGHLHREGYGPVCHGCYDPVPGETSAGARE
jgi:hypothetical protein